MRKSGSQPLSMLSLQVGPIFDLGYTIVTSKLYLDSDLLGKMMQKQSLFC